MLKLINKLFLVLFSLLIVATVATGQKRIKIKMATLAPKGSPWHEVLMKMGREWQEATNGLIRFKIYPDGVAGDEDSMIRKMRIGQFQAAALTFNGISFIDPSVNALAIPMLYDNYEQLDKVRDLIEGEIKRRIEAKGFVLLAWADVGWIRFFSTEPLQTPEELKKMKMFTWAGDEVALRMWKNAGYRVIPLQPIDILTGLQTGLINSFSSPPFVALSSQWFGIANHMLDLPFAPFTGGFVLDKKVWESIPEEYKPALIAAADKVAKIIKDELRHGDQAFIDAMVEHGLIVHEANAETRTLWRETARTFYPDLRGDFAPADIFDRAVFLSDSIRFINSKNTTGH